MDAQVGYLVGEVRLLSGGDGRAPASRAGCQALGQGLPVKAQLWASPCLAMS